MNISDHAYKRAKERCGLNKKALERLYKTLYSHGINRKKTKGNLRKYLDGKYNESEKLSTLIVFDKYLFISRKFVLITIFPIPHDLQRSAKSQIEKTRSN